jgi:hypothetical protein
MFNLRHSPSLLIAQINTKIYLTTETSQSLLSGILETCICVAVGIACSVIAPP